ncbi:hypothetical protein [Paraburkholderia sp.]|uniref:hypothetical protein n=1 Tax=Paraburkholderia sp. TaxID=1926495 RepID=UPI002394DB87|nr:hypothetical protein [Paraburkholderia sp.]MDE1178956.1 hypothetical protein [Paraburkholderia sp.]
MTRKKPRCRKIAGLFFVWLRGPVRDVRRAMKKARLIAQGGLLTFHADERTVSQRERESRNQAGTGVAPGVARRVDNCCA